MHEYVLTLLAAAAVTYLLTPLVRRFAIAVGASHAVRARDVHQVPTPRLGGVAMYGGLAVGLLVASHLGPPLSSAFAETNMSKGLLLAGGLLVLIGFVDDRWGMGALSKLAGQVAAGVILVWSGAEVTWLPWPYGGTLGLTSDQQVAVTILVVVVTINAVNFIDGLDGLAAGIVGIGAAAFFIYYYTLTHRLGLADQTGPALASAVLVGMCLGFLPHNFNPARIFMGDTGSMLLGLLLAYAPISSLASLDPGSLAASHPVNRFGAILPLLLPAAVLLIPYADLLMAVVRRMRAGMSVFAADKKHLQHRLLAIGHSHRASVLVMYLWASLFAGSVVWLSILRTSLYLLVIVTVVALLALLMVSMPRLRFWNRGAAVPVLAGRPAGRAARDRAAAGPARNPAARRPAGTRPTGAAAGGMTQGSGATSPGVTASGVTAPGVTAAGTGAVTPGSGATAAGPGEGAAAAGGPAAARSVLGGSVARGPAAGGPAAGGPPWADAGEPVAGEPAAGEPVAGGPPWADAPEPAMPPARPGGVLARPAGAAAGPVLPAPAADVNTAAGGAPDAEWPLPPKRPRPAAPGPAGPVPVLRGPARPPSAPPA